MAGAISGQTRIVVGAVAVEVVPSAKGFGKKLADQVAPASSDLGKQIGKNLGDEAGKAASENLAKHIEDAGDKAGKLAGKKAGKSFSGSFAQEMRSGVTNAVNKLPTKLKKFSVDIEADDKRAKAALAGIRDELKKFRKQTVGVRIDSGDFDASINSMRARLVDLGRRNVDIPIKADAKAAIAEIDRLKAKMREADEATGAYAKTLRTKLASALESLPDTKSDFSIDLNVDDAKLAKNLKQLNSIRSAIERIQDTPASIDTGDTEKQLRDVEKQIRALDKLIASTNNRQIRVGAQEAKRELEAFIKSVNDADDTKVVVTPEVDDKPARREIGEFARYLEARGAELKRAFPELKPGVDTGEAVTKLIELQGIADAFGDIDFQVSANIGESIAKMAAARAAAEALTSGDYTIDIKSNAEKFLETVGKIEDKLGVVREVAEEITPEVDTEKPEAEIGEFARKMQRTITDLSKKLPPIEIRADSTPAEVEAKTVRDLIESLSDLDVNTPAGLNEFQKRLESIADVSDRLKTDDSLGAALQKNLESVGKVARDALGDTEPPKIEPEVDEKKADAEMGAFRRKLIAEINAINATIPDIEINENSDAIDRAQARVKQALKDIAEIDPSTPGGFARLSKAVQEVTADLQRLRNARGVSPDLIDNFAQAEQAAQKLETRIKSLSDAGNTGGGGNFFQRLLASVLGIDKPTRDAEGSIRQLGDAAENTGNRGGNALQRIVARVLGIGAPARDAGGALNSLGNAAKKAGDDGGNAVSTLASNLGLATAESATSNLSIIILSTAIAALFPLLAPLAAVASGAFAAIATGALLGVGALGALAIALGPVLAGLQKYKQYKDSLAAGPGAATGNTAAQDATELSRQVSLANAQDAVADATRNVARARITGAQAVKSANQALARSERSLTEAQRSEKKAQQDLTDARRQAQRQLINLNLEVRRGALDQKQANLDLVDAQRAYQEVLADPTASEEQIQRAGLALQQAKLSVDEQKQKNKELAEDKAKADRTGVEGTDLVINAQEQLRQSTLSVADAQQAVVDSAERAAQAQLDAIEQVRAAQQSLTQSQRGLTVAQAQEAVPAGGQGTPKGKDWAEGLTESEKQMVEFLYGTLIPAYEKAKAILQQPIFAGLKTFIDSLAPLQPVVETILQKFGQAIGDFFVKLGEFANTPAFKSFLDYLSKNAEPILSAVGDLFLGLVAIFTQLIVAFGPSSEVLLNAFAELAQKGAEMLTTFTQSEGFDQFIQYIIDNAPIFGKLLADLVLVLIKFLIAIAPLGEPMLKLVGVFADFFASLPPDVLLAIVGGILALAGALFAVGGVAVLAIPLIIAACVAFIAILVKAWNESETFRSIVLAVFEAVKSGFMRFWEATAQLRQAFVDVWTAVWEIVQTVWNGVLKPIFMALWAIIVNVLLPVVLWIYEKAFKPTFAIITTVLGVFLAMFRITVETLKLLFKGLAFALKFVYDHTIGPLIDLFMKHFGDDLTNMFKKAVETLGKVWDNVTALIADPIYIVVHYVLNEGILKGINTVFGKLDSGWKDVKIPDESIKKYAHKAVGGSFATGGVLPGYDPGNDIVPAMLSPGEGVLVPQAVRQLGPQQILDWNARALRGQDISFYARGGVVDLSNQIVSFERNSGVPFRKTSGLRPGDPGNHGKGYAADTASSTDNMVRLAKWLFQRAGYLMQLIHSGGGGFYVAGGKPVGANYYRSDIAGHYDHVHVAMNEAGLAAAKAAGYAVTNSPATGVGDGDSWLSVFGDLKDKIVNGLSGGIAKVKGLLGKAGDSDLVKSLLATGTTMKDKALKWAQDKLKNLLPDVVGAVKGVFDFITGGENTKDHSAGRHASRGTAQAYAKSQLKKFGWSEAQYPALNQLWQGESGWRWDAKNPSSGAYGIPQSLPAAKMATSGRDWASNAFTQINWGLNYIKQRYGTPDAANRFKLQRNFYDRGGYLPKGLSVVQNNTGKPEPVLTDTQWQTLMADRRTEMRGGVEVGIRVNDGVVPGLIQAQVDRQFGVLADANIYGTI